MKRTYLLLILCFTTYFANAQEPFITTWNVGSGLTIEIPIIEDDEIPDSYTVDFGDGTVLIDQSGVTSHTYSNYGIYTVTISGTFSRISFGEDNIDNNSFSLLTVEQWGDIQWTSMEEAFLNCQNLTITATDIPDLSQVTNMSKMFWYCISLNQSLNNWDVSNVTNMSETFRRATSFNEPLNDWDVSNVTNMESIFHGASSFNQPLNDWNVSNVTNMQRVFSGCYLLNQPLDNWDVSNVTNMQGMFGITQSFNQPLNNWDVSNVTNMGGMFSVSIFNQSLDNWDISNVTDISGMFYNNNYFNQPLNSWDVSNVTDMEAMFFIASSFNQPLDSWDVSNVTNMGWMFLGSTSFNQDLSNWEFNSDITFEYTSDDHRFISYTALDVENYDALLNRFVELGLENKEIGVEGLKYCDYETRDNLINNLGWTIIGDNLAEDCTASMESFEENQLSVYPNPIKDVVYIQSDNLTVKEVTIYNLQGGQLITAKQNLESINTTNLSSGIYLLHIQTDKGLAKYKLVKN
ncbi:MAG: hypothetical protein BM557_04915 [Flavobacterium sp. MedPE-SWcel]|nr:MAG: hypothetical protein BM557_04915 [Flavobacterium sp. MedPE-SWcel]